MNTQQNSSKVATKMNKKLQICSSATQFKWMLNECVYVYVCVLKLFSNSLMNKTRFAAHNKITLAEREQDRRRGTERESIAERFVW